MSNIKFIAIARAQDNVVVCSHATDSNTNGRDSLAEVLNAPDFAGKVQAGQRYRLTGDFNTFNFSTDTSKLVYIVITAKDYPERVVFPMINELMSKFKDSSAKAQTCGEGGLDRKCKKNAEESCT